MGERVIIRWMPDGAMQLYTDSHNIDVISIDENCPRDRVFRFTSCLTRCSPSEIDAIIGTDDFHVAGDMPEVEQAARTRLNIGPSGKPTLTVIANPTP